MKSKITFLLILFLLVSCKTSKIETSAEIMSLADTSWINESTYKGLTNTFRIDFFNDDKCNLTLSGTTVTTHTYTFFYKQDGLKAYMYKNKNDKEPDYEITIKSKDVIIEKDVYKGATRSKSEYIRVKK